MNTLQPTAAELKTAEQKFNRLHNRFYTAISTMENAIEKLPRKGNTPEECQKVAIIVAIKDLESVLNGLCVEDFLNAEN